jgi:Uma2 family endonuclease
MVTQERLYSAEELWELSHRPENEGKRLRLIDGVIYEEGLLNAMSPTGRLHGRVTWLLTVHMGNHVLANALGEMTGAETGYTLYKNPAGRDTVLAPDIGFVRADRLPEDMSEHYVPFAPDLAVEVLSPSNKPAEIVEKVDLYLRYGTRMVWVIYPGEQRVQVYRPTGEAHRADVRFLSAGDTLDGEDVLPGFKLPLNVLFAPPTGAGA